MDENLYVDQQLSIQEEKLQTTLQSQDGKTGDIKSLFLMMPVA